MKNLTKYFIFILDELIIIALVISILYYLKVSLELFIGAILIMFIILSFISYIFLPQFKKPVTGIEGLIGMKGIALESFKKEGMVLVHGEQWKAITNNGYIRKGDEVIVLDVKGLILIVKKI
jgi:membrane-bound serine protease (ClpP class)